MQLKIFGRVQGVFYRAETQRVAQRLGLTGFVKNEPDGSVLVFASGKPTQLAKLQQWCAKGPAAARVEKVLSQPSPAPPSKFNDFQIL